ncbi:hypothetical protein [Anabaena sp. CCY 9402-a]
MPINTTELPANATKMQVNAKDISIKESFKQMRRRSIVVDIAPHAERAIA